MTSFFHAYDLRGTYPDEIDEEKAKDVGKAYGTFTEAEKVLIGRDGRTHGEEITEAFIKGILSTGTDVAYANMTPTPVIYFGQVENGFKSAAIVTASHNPSEYTGFKFSLEGAKAMSRSAGMKKIEQLYKSKEFDTGQGQKEQIELVESYIEAVKQQIGEINQEVLINCGNGVTGLMARKLFNELGCGVKIINEEVDGSFPNHLADPGSDQAKELTEGVLGDEGLGIIFDGDGDRAGFVLPNYGYIEEDKIITLLSEESLDKEKGKVVHDLRTSKLVAEKIEEHGGTSEESRVGHTFISEKIHEDNNVVFAGELSGHFYFPAYGFPWDDGLFAAALMTKITGEKDIKSKLENFPNYPVSPELRIDCPHDAKEEVTTKIAEEYSNHDISTKDGVKIHFESGWALVRPSNTQPKMSVRCEADTQEDLDQILEEVETKVKTYISESQ
jgi:phosphomannomutase